jgi:hypothetical protein
MTRTIPASDMRRLLAHLDAFKELTDLLRHGDYDVPGGILYYAIGAEMALRDTLLDPSLSDVAVTDREVA